MKKTAFAFLMFLILVGACTGNPERTIVGTWTDLEGITWKFNADGKLEYANRPGDNREYQYSIFHGEQRSIITIYGVDRINQEYNLEYSKDGETLRLTGGRSLPYWNTAGPGWHENMLTKLKNVSNIRELNGTWIYEFGYTAGSSTPIFLNEFIINNGNFEYSHKIEGEISFQQKGTLSIKNGNIIMKLTNITANFDDEMEWYTSDELKRKLISEGELTTEDEINEFNEYIESVIECFLVNNTLNLNGVIYSRKN